MSRLSTLVWMLVVVISSFVLYRVKYEVQSLRMQVADISHELEKERESLHVVAAEWAYLNRPERIKSLAAKYLQSDYLMVEQIAEVEAIPFPRKQEASVAKNPTLHHVSVVPEANITGDRW